MTQKERLLAVFNRQKPDVMPWFADLTYWYSSAQYRGILDQKYLGNGVVKLYENLGCGCHEHALNLPCKLSYPQDEVKIIVTEEKGIDGKPFRQKVEWRTLIGTLTQVKEFEPLSYSWAYREYPIKTPADLRIFRFMLSRQQAIPDYSIQKRQIELFGDWGVASSIPPRSPLANLLVIWMGVVNAIYALHDALAEVEETMEVMAAADDPIYEAICQSPAPLVYFGENITGEVVSPYLFKKYYALYYRKQVPALHKAGKRIFVHIDGTMRTVLPLIADTGIDCAQSLTVAPVGDVAVKDLRTLAGDNLILWAGVPAAYFSPLYPEEEVRRVVMESLEYHLDGAKFIMGVCDQVPPDGDLKRVELVTELVEKYGRY
jgi:hypothetical protein